MLSPNSRSLWVIIIINIGVPSITHRRKNSGHCLKSLTTQPTFSHKKVRGRVDLRVKSQNFIRIANVVQSHSYGQGVKAVLIVWNEIVFKKVAAISMSFHCWMSFVGILFKKCYNYSQHQLLDFIGIWDFLRLHGTFFHYQLGLSLLLAHPLDLWLPESGKKVQCGAI